MPDQKIPEICWEKLKKFEGYGPSAPRVVFIGYEEKGPHEWDDQIRNVQARCRLMESYGGDRGDKNVWHTGEDSVEWVEGKQPLTPGKVRVWNVASRIVATLSECDPAVSGSPDGGTAEDWKSEYLRLGTRRGTTLLTELMPFPRRGKGGFNETILSCRFRTNKNMEDAILPGRFEMLRNVIDRPSVRYVFMYGAAFDKHCDSIVGSVVSWETIPMKSRDLKIAKIGETVFARTGFFGGQARDALRYSQIPKLVSHVARIAGLPCDRR